jgi:2-C-methyl-D-erythritol 4-phosphate cytidylyltransferase
METPQCFTTQLLRDAYAEVVQRGGVPTDEVSVLQETGRAVHLVPNPSPNPKITFPGDLILAEKLLEL